VAEYLQIFRARVPEESVAALLEVRPAAIAEAQRLCPELLGARLVRLDDTSWLDVLTWSRPDGEQRLMARVAEFDAITKMHGLLAEVEEPLRGEIIHTST
jgi:membrane-bound lytic murein transglycosylase MltF